MRRAEQATTADRHQPRGAFLPSGQPVRAQQNVAWQHRAAGQTERRLPLPTGCGERQRGCRKHLAQQPGQRLGLHRVAQVAVAVGAEQQHPDGIARGEPRLGLSVQIVQCQPLAMPFSELARAKQDP